MSQGDYDYLEKVGSLGGLRSAPTEYKPKKDGLFEWWLKEQSSNFQKVHRIVKQEVPRVIQFQRFMDNRRIACIVEGTSSTAGNYSTTLDIRRFDPHRVYNSEEIPF